MTLYDDSFRDIAKRLVDDDLMTINVVKQASDMIIRFGETLEAIEKLGHSHGHGYGYTCANMAQKALEE